MRKTFNKTVIFLLLIVLLAGTLRIIRMIQENRFSLDAYLYFEMAENWAYHGAEYAASYSADNIPPLLPWLMAAGYNLGLDAEQTGLILGILLGSLMPLAAFWIALNLFSGADEKRNISSVEDSLPASHVYALVAAFLVAVNPFLARISVSCLREILYLPLFSLAVAFAVSAVYNKSVWKWCIFAFLTALANMTRREGISLIVIFFIWLAVELISDRKGFVKDMKYYAAASGSVACIFTGLAFLTFYMFHSGSYTWSPFYINID